MGWPQRAGHRGFARKFKWAILFGARLTELPEIVTSRCDFFEAALGFR